jgi:hypothetical protein
VLSYTSMFEGFWREDEIYEKLKESRTQLNLTRSNKQKKWWDELREERTKDVEAERDN